MFLQTLPNSGPTVLKSHVVEAAVFKSGLIFLTREAEIPAGEADYRIEDVPVAIDGTFWYSSTDNIKLLDLTTKLQILDKKEPVNAKTITDYIISNVGKHVKLGLSGTPLERVSGTIVDVGTQSGIVTLRKDDGVLRSIGITSVVELDPTGLSAKSTRTSKEPVVLMTFHLRSSKPTKIRFLSLEKGATWTGSYLITLGDMGKGKIEGKAQIAMGSQHLEDTLTSAIAGLPNLPATWRYDLASGIGSLTSYLQSQQDQYIGYQLSDKDPFALIPQLYNQRFQSPFGNQFANYNSIGGFGGGMGGGGFGGPGGPRDEEAFRMPEAPATAQVQSLYAYRMGSLTLEPGERLTRRLFERDMDYTSLFTATITDQPDAVVNNVLRMKNESAFPWTDGLALVMKEGIPVSQIEMPFTPINETADLRLAVAKDVKVTPTLNTIATVDINLSDWPHQVMKKATDQLTVHLYNSRQEQIQLELHASNVGTVSDAGGGEVSQDRSKSDAYNPGNQIVWTVTLMPGERKTITANWERIFSAGYR